MNRKKRERKEQKRRTSARILQLGVLILLAALAVVVVCVYALPSAAPPAPPQPAASYQRAMELLRKFRLEDAESELEARLADRPNDRQTRSELRWLYFNQFRGQEVEALLENGLQRMPDQYDFAVDLLMSEFRPQTPREVFSYWERVNREQPGQASVLATLGYCFWRTGDADKARESFQQALDGRPDDVRSRLLAAEFMIELGEFESAGTLPRCWMQSPRIHQALTIRISTLPKMSIKNKHGG